MKKCFGGRNHENELLWGFLSVKETKDAAASDHERKRENFKNFYRLFCCVENHAILKTKQF